MAELLRKHYKPVTIHRMRIMRIFIIFHCTSRGRFMQNKGIGKTDANCKKYFSKFRL